MTKRVIVTGASRGIGKAIARSLASEGYEVGINFLKKKEAAEDLLREIVSKKQKAYLIPFDISNREETKKALEKDLQDKGLMWGIVCNAGIAMDSPFPILEGEQWDRVIHTNLDGLYNVLKPLVMPLATARKGGRIVTLSSISGLIGNRGQVNYSASKAGIIGATKALALELAKRNITCNVVAPGVIETDMVENLVKEVVTKLIPMRRYGKPEEVASVVNFLMSEEAAYITGQVISVNGGMA